MTFGFSLSFPRRLSAGGTAAPTPTGYWVTSLNSNISTTALIGQSIGTDASGNSYSVGVKSDNAAPTGYWFLSKYDSNGALQWQKQLTDSDTIGNCSAYGCIVDSSGNIYAVGKVDGGHAYESNAAVIKYNTSGVLQWQKQLGDGLYYQQNNAATFDSSGNIYVTGTTGTPSLDSWNDVLITKYNTSGALLGQWDLYDPALSSYNIGQSICSDASGNYFVGGYTEAASASSRDDGLIAKFNSSNALQWQKGLLAATWIVGGRCYINGITSDSSGNIYCCGYSADSAYANLNSFIAKLDTSGTILWQRFVTGAELNFNSVKTDASNNVYVVGYDATNSSVAILKYNSSGVIQWQRSVSQSGFLSPYSVSVDTSGNFYITGYFANGIYYDEVNIKLPTDGSRTGTYGPWTYAASSLIDSVGALTTYSTGLTYGTPTLTASSATLTETTPAYGTTVTIV